MNGVFVMKAFPMWLDVMLRKLFGEEIVSSQEWVVGDNMRVAIASKNRTRRKTSFTSDTGNW